MENKKDTASTPLCGEVKPLYRGNSPGKESDVRKQRYEPERRIDTQWSMKMRERGLNVHVLGTSRADNKHGYFCELLNTGEQDFGRKIQKENECGRRI